MKNEFVDVLGKHRVMFAVTDIRDVLARLEAYGAEIVGGVVHLQRPASVVLCPPP